MLQRDLRPYWATSALGENAGCLGRLSGLLPLSVREIPFPTPAYTDDPFASFVKSVFGLFFVPKVLKLLQHERTHVNEKKHKVQKTSHTL